MNLRKLLHILYYKFSRELLYILCIINCCAIHENIKPPLKIKSSHLLWSKNRGNKVVEKIRTRFVDFEVLCCIKCFSAIV